MIEQPELHIDDDEFVVPVLKEELSVEKRIITTGVVRLEKSIRTTETLIDEDLLRHSVFIEHVPINRHIDEVASTRQEGETTIIPVMEEIVIVTKQLVLKEEIRITRRQEQSHYHEAVPLRMEEVNVSREELQEKHPQMETKS